ncbi:hypothetical protein MMC29_001797 [Sticta canariensis]|nr:hypothetical protein [Sticta canariensis]
MSQDLTRRAIMPRCWVSWVKLSRMRRRGEVLARAKLIQSKNSLPKRLWWAAVDKNSFEELVRDVRVIVQGLWALLDSFHQDEVIVKNLASSTALKSSTDDHDDASPLSFAWLNQNPSLSHFRDLVAIFSGHLTNLVPKSGSASTGVGFYAREPVLVEFKSVIPKLKSKLKTRIENLAVLLSTTKDPSFLTLHCLGVFEDRDSFAFIFQYPTKPTNLLIAPQHVTLLNLLRDPTIQLSLCTPPGWLHKDFRSESILFFPIHPSSSSVASRYFLSEPYLTGFTFSRIESPTEVSEQPSANPFSDIYRHPHTLGDPCVSFEKRMDLYSLGVVMVEIAEWCALKVDVVLSALASVGP